MEVFGESNSKAQTFSDLLGDDLSRLIREVDALREVLMGGGAAQPQQRTPSGVPEPVREESPKEGRGSPG
jgi:hypothetical protein